jgi:hypothetical protein
MGKKRRMIAHPEKYGRKFASHPALSRVTNQEQAEELPAVVAETPTPVLKAAKEELAPKPKTAAVPKKRVATRSRTVKPRAKKTTSKK